MPREIPTYSYQDARTLCGGCQYADVVGISRGQYAVECQAPIEPIVKRKEGITFDQYLEKPIPSNQVAITLKYVRQPGATCIMLPGIPPNDIICRRAQAVERNRYMPETMIVGRNELDSGRIDFRLT